MKNVIAKSHQSFLFLSVYPAGKAAFCDKFGLLSDVVNAHTNSMSQSFDSEVLLSILKRQKIIFVK